MACFLVPVTEAVVTTVITKAVESKEKKEEVFKATAPVTSAETGIEKDTNTNAKIPFSRKLKWLNNLLWGGAFLLAFEHVWSGEVVPWFPFLTAAENPASAAEMLHEMATSGVAMAVLVTAFWAGLVLASNAIEKRGHKEISSTVKEGVI